MSKKKYAIYPGSFDPITNGHIDIINRAKKVFDEIIIAVIQNPGKEPFFTLKQRLELIKQVFCKDKQVQAESFEGLLVDFARKKGILTIIRGLRAVSDFDFEFQMALTNRYLDTDIDTVFFMTDKAYSYLSSSLVRQLAMLQGDISGLVPLEVAAALKGKIKNG